MMSKIKNLLALILAAAAVGGFVWVVVPVFKSIAVHRSEIAVLEDTLAVAEEISSLQTTLGQQYDMVTPQDKERLQTLLPSNVDNVQFILEMEQLLNSYNLELVNIGAGSVDQKAPAGGHTEPLTANFTVRAYGAYGDFLEFMNHLETSLRIIDVQQINFVADREQEDGNTDHYQYMLALQTYWLPE